MVFAQAFPSAESSSPPLFVYRIYSYSLDLSLSVILSDKFALTMLCKVGTSLHYSQPFLCLLCNIYVNAY